MPTQINTGTRKRLPKSDSTGDTEVPETMTDDTRKAFLGSLVPRTLGYGWGLSLMHDIKQQPAWKLPAYAIGAIIVCAAFIFVTWDRYGVLAALPLILSVQAFVMLAWRYNKVGNRRGVEVSLLGGMTFVMLFANPVIPAILHR